MEKEEERYINDRILSSENIIKKMDELKDYLVDLSYIIEEDSRLLEGLRIISFAQDQISINL